MEKDLATYIICGMRESEESKVKSKLWMVEGEAREVCRNTN